MTFRSEDAIKYGVEEAIVIDRFRILIGYHRANETHRHDGRTWIYNSLRALRDLFPWWSDWQLRRITSSLVQQSVLVTGSYNQNGYDRTKWWAFQNESIHLLKAANGTDGNHQSKEPEPPDDTQEVNKEVQPEVRSTAYPSNPIDLYHKTLATFLSQNDEADWEFAQEGAHIKKLLKKARARDDPEAFMAALLRAFWDLTKGTDKFWSEQPFTASTLNSNGIYTRVLKAMANGQSQDSLTEEQAERIAKIKFS